jgi:hypothetical protein
MGLLDDAIREHLELKRRHGAAEDDVRRQEQEALGPPRRGEVPEPLLPGGAASADPDAEVAAAPDSLEADSVPELPAEVAPAPDGDPDLEPEPVLEPPAAYAAPREPAPSVYEDEPWLEESRPPAPPEEEDVLEETPDFLQETPEHDRLWFEQKPPKDFDFDK